MDTLQTIRDAHAWLRWMTGRTLAAAEELTPEEFRRTFPIGLGSVHGTMVHLAGAERVWIAALEGDDPGVQMPVAGDLPDVPAVRRALSEVRGRWDRYLARLDAAECDRVIVRVRDGREYRQRAGDALMQVPTHALYHNAQLSFMFRSMGRSLPDSSWILWARARIEATA